MRVLSLFGAASLATESHAISLNKKKTAVLSKKSGFLNSKSPFVMAMAESRNKKQSRKSKVANPPPTEADEQLIRDTVLGRPDSSPVDNDKAYEICSAHFDACEATAHGLDMGSQPVLHLKEGPATAATQHHDMWVPKDVALKCPIISKLIDAGHFNPDWIPEDLGMTRGFYMDGCMGCIAAHPPEPEPIDVEDSCFVAWDVCWHMESPQIHKEVNETHSEPYVTHNTAVTKCPNIKHLVDTGLLPAADVPEKLYASDYIHGCMDFLSASNGPPTESGEYDDDMMQNAHATGGSMPALVQKKGIQKKGDHVPFANGDKQTMHPTPSDECHVVFQMCFADGAEAGTATGPVPANTGSAPTGPVLANGGSAPLPPAAVLEPSVYNQKSNIDCVLVHQIAAAMGHDGEPLKEVDFRHHCLAYFGVTDQYDEHHETHVDKCMECEHKCFDENPALVACHEAAETTSECMNCHSCHGEGLMGMFSGCGSILDFSESTSCHQKCSESADCSSCHTFNDHCFNELSKSSHKCLEQCAPSCKGEDPFQECQTCRAANLDDEKIHCDDVCHHAEELATEAKAMGVEQQHAEETHSPDFKVGAAPAVTSPPSTAAVSL